MKIFISTSDAQQLMAGIEQAFRKEFPNGYFKIWQDDRGFSKGSITISLGLIDDRNNLPSKIRDNDPMQHKFMLHNEGERGWDAVGLMGGLSINPVEKYLAMSHLKTGWRKTKGDDTKVLKAFTRFFGRLHKLVKDNESNIYGRDRYDDKYFR